MFLSWSLKKRMTRERGESEKQFKPWIWFRCEDFDTLVGRWDYAATTAVKASVSTRG